jgi:predicted transcriptional regulator
MTTTPQLTTPEGIEGMVAPGQENILEEFVKEQETQEPELLLGKFKSQDDLAKAYQELERKLGQPKQEADPEPSPAEGYSADQAVGIYGEGPVEALKEKGIDMADVMFKADQGQDISEHYDTLAETFGVTRQVVENYVSKAQGSAPAEAPGLTESDAAELKAMVGGDAAFSKLSQWAAGNLDQAELAKYNAVVDSGNKDAIEWALKALQARVAAPDSVVEPKLYGGGEAAAETKFESQQQVLDAMNKRNSRGQRMYDVDEAYRDKVQKLLAVSDVF